MLSHSHDYCSPLSYICPCLSQNVLHSCGTSLFKAVVYTFTHFSSIHPAIDLTKCIRELPVNIQEMSVFICVYVISPTVV